MVGAAGLPVARDHGRGGVIATDGLTGVQELAAATVGLRLQHRPVALVAA
jgi:hypothetical protein